MKIKLNTGVGKKTKPGNWKFTRDLLKSFDDHIERSIPHYNDCHKLTCRISDFFLTEDNLNYIDIGSTTGSLIEKISNYQKSKKINICGIEIEKSFCQFSKKRLSRLKTNHKVDILNKDIFEFLKRTNKKYDFMTSLFTLQFIKPSKRSVILEQIYKKLNWGGGFVFFEKVRGSDARFQDIKNFLLNLEKMENKFSSEEIYGKSMSLIGKMEPFTNNGNLQILENAGFKDIEIIFKYINFQGYLCIK